MLSWNAIKHLLISKLRIYFTIFHLVGHQQYYILSIKSHILSKVTMPANE